MTNVAQKRQIAAWSALETYLVCGVIFGWPNLKKIFIEKEFFCQDFSCVPKSNNLTDIKPINQPTTQSTLNFTIALNSSIENVTSVDQEALASCPCQEQNLTAAYGFACVVFALVGVPVGAIFDRFGTMVTRLCGVSLFLCGNILVLQAGKDLPNNESMLYPALCLVACSGLFFLTCQQQTGNLFTEARGKVISMINGAMDSSSSFSVVLLLIFHNYGFDTTFSIFGALAILILIRTLLFYTKTSIPYPLPDDYILDPPFELCNSKPDSFTKGDKITEVDEDKDSHKSLPSEKNPEIPKFFSKDVFFSPLYASTVLFFVTQVYRVYIFLATMSNSTAETILYTNPNTTQSDALIEANKMVTKFGLVQALGVFFAPINGIIIDKLMSKTKAKYLTLSVSMLCCTALGTIFSLITVIPAVKLQYGAFLFSVLHRAFVYSGNAAVIAMCFPPEYFGKLYGFSQFATALSGQLIDPTFGWANSTSFRTVNTTLLFIEIATIWHAGILLLYSRDSKLKEVEAKLDKEEEKLEILDSKFEAEISN